MGVVSVGRRLSPEETLAAVTGQGVKVIACGPVTAHHTVPRLVPTGHSFCVGVAVTAPECGRGSSQLWATLDPLPPSAEHLPGHALGPTPCITFILLFLVSGPRFPTCSSSAAAGHRVWCGMSLPKVLLCPCFSLDLRSCPCLEVGVMAPVPGKQGPSVVFRDHVGRAETLDPGQRPGEVFPACPWC